MTVTAQIEHARQSVATMHATDAAGGFTATEGERVRLVVERVYALPVKTASEKAGLAALVLEYECGAIEPAILAALHRIAGACLGKFRS